MDKPRFEHNNCSMSLSQKQNKNHFAKKSPLSFAAIIASGSQQRQPQRDEVFVLDRLRRMKRKFSRRRNDNIKDTDEEEEEEQEEGKPPRQRRRRLARTLKNSSTSSCFSTLSSSTANTCATTTSSSFSDFASCPSSIFGNINEAANSKNEDDDSLSTFSSASLSSALVDYEERQFGEEEDDGNHEITRTERSPQCFPPEEIIPAAESRFPTVTINGKGGGTLSRGHYSRCCCENLAEAAARLSLDNDTDHAGRYYDEDEGELMDMNDDADGEWGQFIGLEF